MEDQKRCLFHVSLAWGETGAGEEARKISCNCRILREVYTYNRSLLVRVSLSLCQEEKGSKSPEALNGRASFDIILIYSCFSWPLPITGCSKPFFTYLKTVLGSEFKAISRTLSLSWHSMDTSETCVQCFSLSRLCFITWPVPTRNSEGGENDFLCSVVVTQHMG